MSNNSHELNKIINATVEDVADVNIWLLSKYFLSKESWTGMTIEPGREHYRLLSYISYLYNGSRLYDMGTYKGCSAVALSHNPANLVISYDIANLVETKRPDNVEFRLGNYFNDIGGILQSPFIFYDVDPHDGKLEYATVDFLKDIEYNGLVLFDDIKVNNEMKKFWNSIDLPKHELTHIGHWSGTGIVDFSGKTKNKSK